MKKKKIETKPLTRQERREQFQMALYSLSVDVGTPIVGALIAVAATRMRAAQTGAETAAETIAWACERAPHGKRGFVRAAMEDILTQQNKRSESRRLSLSSRATLSERLDAYRQRRAHDLFHAAGFRECESRWVEDARGMSVTLHFNEANDGGSVSVERHRVWSSNGKWSATAVQYTVRLPADWTRRVAAHAHSFGPGTFVLNERDGEFLVARQSRGFDILTKWERRKGSRCQGARVAGV